MKDEDAGRNNDVNSQPSEQETNESPKTAPQQALTEPQAVLSDVTQSVATEQPTREQSSDSTYDSKGGIPRVWEFRIGVFLAVMNLCTLLALLYQNAETRRSTDIAADGLKLSRTVAQLEQRAWVFCELTAAGPVAGEPVDMTLVVKNSGKSFARDVSLDAALLLHDVTKELGAEGQRAASQADVVATLEQSITLSYA